MNKLKTDRLNKYKRINEYAESSQEILTPLSKEEYESIIEYNPTNIDYKNLIFSDEEIIFIEKNQNKLDVTFTEDDIKDGFI